MADGRVLCQLKVLHNGTSRHDSAVQMVHAEALQRLCAEVLLQFLARRLLGEHPVVEFERRRTRAGVSKEAVELLLALATIQNLFRLETTQELLDVVVGTLTREELACRDVEESHAAGSLAKVDGRQEVVLLVGQHIVAHGHAGRDQLGDTTLDERLGELRVFQLIADGHTPASTYELGQIRVERMMRESGHLRLGYAARPIVAARQRDTQNAGRHDGILAIRLIEVAATKQQHCVRILLLEREELLHHRRQSLVVFLCHLLVLSFL